MYKKPTKREQRDQNVVENLFYEMDDIAASLGIPPRSEREWTDEEADRVWLKAGGSAAGLTRRPQRSHSTGHS